MDLKKNENKPNGIYEIEEILNNKLGTDMNYKHKYLWPNIIFHIMVQISGFMGTYFMIFHAKWATIVWTFLIGFCVTQSVTLGAHRAYGHRNFKMKMPLRIFFMYFFTMAGQNSLLVWVRDHRLHHKYSDTDADPHNAARGFFFSHMGWLMAKKHPLVREKQKQIDVSDILADDMIMFHYKYYYPLYFIIAVLIPVSVPMYFWNETLWSALFVSHCWLYVTLLHFTWVINSIAHLWGTKPFDERIRARQSVFPWVVSIGEGWHNFHHAFPWDSRQSEFGQVTGMSTWVLDFFTYLGLAYDLKKVSTNIVHGHMKRHGDGTGDEILTEKKRNKTQESDSVLENTSTKLE